MRTNISITPSLKEIFPGLSLSCLSGDVSVAPSGEMQKNEMEEICRALSETLSYETIRENPAIKSLKTAYRKLGKDPNRYRPSAESLLRRIASGKGLYLLNNVVDALNLVSVRTGYSICGYDAGLINGAVQLAIGQPDEFYEGIGRGPLNIDRLPVFRDETGAFGTPTSDSVRTMINDRTRSFLMIFPVFEESPEPDKALEMLTGYLKEYAGATHISIETIT